MNTVIADTRHGSINGSHLIAYIYTKFGVYVSIIAKKEMFRV